MPLLHRMHYIVLYMQNQIKIKMIPKRYWCFLYPTYYPSGGMHDCIGSASTIRDAVILIKTSADYDSDCECNVWDIWDDQLILNETHIAEYIIEPFQLTDKTKNNDKETS